MVHPGILIVGIFGVVVTSVVIYTILKEEINDFLESFEKPSAAGNNQNEQQGQGQRQGQGQGQRNNRFAQDDSDFDQGPRGQSSSMYQADYELRQRRFQSDEDEDENLQQHPNRDMLLADRLRKINETEQANAANEARLAEMERAMREREESLQRREQDLASSVLQQQQQLHMPQSSEIYQNPFAGNEPLIRDCESSTDTDTPVVQQQQQPSQQQTSTPEVNSRTADAILRHNLSSNHQENVNPFADPLSLLETASTRSASARSSVHDDDDMDAFANAEDRSVTVGHDDDEDLDWTEAEVGSIGSHDSDESWGSGH